MKIAFFDSKQYDINYFDKENQDRHEITYFKENLTLDNIDKTKGFDAVCAFVNTQADAKILEGVSKNGVKFWLQRSMGYNRVDLATADKLGIKVFRVPNYSAESVAEHAVSLLISLNRRIPQAHARTTKWDFSLDGLEGKVISNSLVGVIGAGKIGQGFIKTMVAMGAHVIVHDEFAEKNFPDTAKKMGFHWVPKEVLFENSDFISLHCPLLPTTEHIIDAKAIASMKKNVVLINCARGELIDTTALVKALKEDRIAGAGLDVLERENGRFFFNLTNDRPRLQSEDREWNELLHMDNVIITAHQAFFTEIALGQIAHITLNNADEAQAGEFKSSLQLQKDGKVING